MNPTAQTPALGTPEYTNYLVNQGNSLGMNLNQYKVPAATDSVISTDAIGQTQPLKLPESTASTAAEGLSGMSISYAQTAKAQQDQLTKERKEAQTDVNSDRVKLEETMSQVLDTTASIPKLEEDAKLNEKAQKVTDTTNKVEASERAQVNELRRLEGSSLTDVQKNAKIREINRRYAFEQADLALIQSAANRDFETASNILNRKVELQLEPLKLKLDYQKYFYENNRDRLTKAEDREFQAIIKNNEREYEREMTVRKEANDLLLKAMEVEAEIPQNVRDQINDYPELAYEIMASNGISLAKPVSRTSSGSIIPGSGSAFASDLDAIIGATLSTIPSKFGQETFVAQMSKARNDADRMNLVAAQVLKGQPAEFKRDFGNQAVGVSMIDKAIAELDKGVQTGALQNGAQYVYNLAGKDFDPGLAKISGYITSAIQPYRNSVTGAAWGDQEEAEYQSLFGSTKYSPQELKQRLLQTKELLKSKSAAGLNAFVNPLGSYENQFQTGTLAPTNDNPLGLDLNPLGLDL